MNVLPLLAALAAAPERIVSFPRGDLRRSTTRLPSRWLLPSLRGLSGQPGLQATRWESVSGAWLDRSPSYAAGLSHGGVLASEQEWRIRAVLAGYGSGVAADEVLACDEVAGRAMAMIRGWASDVLPRFDGDVSGHGIPGPANAGQVVSPTALEAWTTCPHAYFVKRLLRVEPPETPEDLVKISRLPLGNQLDMIRLCQRHRPGHRILHTFVSRISFKESGSTDWWRAAPLRSWLQSRPLTTPSPLSSPEATAAPITSSPFERSSNTCGSFLPQRRQGLMATLPYTGWPQRRCESRWPGGSIRWWQ